MSCCTSGLDDTFTEKTSRTEADSYRRKGLPKRARKLVASIESAGKLAGKTLLEIGVGAGGVTVELLRRGVTRATGVDAVAAQLANARVLAGEFNVGDRVDFVHADFTATSQLPHADIVIMDRVVCCYPEWQPLVSAAAAHADTVLAMTYPRDTWWMHATARAINFSRVILRSDFRFRVHPPQAMHAMLNTLGMKTRVAGRYFGWEILLATRVS
jgi:2-polyprenyl-3-methyl-5-hydroxy-6-metoxy-1,4-benzoquinol methylase